MTDQDKGSSPPSHYNWTGVKTPTNGTTFIKSNLFVFLLGQLSLGLIGIAGFAVTYGQNTQKFIDLNNRVTAAETLAKRMDDSGTNFSHYNIQSADKRLTSLEIRISANEEQTKRIAVMDEKITRIDKTVDEIRMNVTHK